MKHVTEAQQFDRGLLERIFSSADALRTAHGRPLAGSLMACLFYEPSTRTRFSFEAAMHRLGGSVIMSDNAGAFSSAAKGETLEDTIKVVSGYVDVIVLRHNEEGAAARAAGVSRVPIINAGDGGGQHPTQALLDLYTIWRERGRIDGASVALVGDLRYGRTARSLAYLLGKYEGITLHCVAPRQLAMREDIVEYCRRHGVDVRFSHDLAEVLPAVDCVYMTRIQKERMPPEEYEAVKGSFIMTPELAATMRPGAIIMHPLPRVDEIAPGVDADPRARYFEQAENGLYIRMALLKELLGRT